MNYAFRAISGRFLHRDYNLQFRSDWRTANVTLFSSLFLFFFLKGNFQMYICYVMLYHQTNADSKCILFCFANVCHQGWVCLCLQRIRGMKYWKNVREKIKKINERVLPVSIAYRPFFLFLFRSSGAKNSACLNYI